MPTVEPIVNPGSLLGHHHPPSTRAALDRRSYLLSPVQWRWALACGVLFLILLIDAMTRPLAFFDVSLMKTIQRLELTGVRELSRVLTELTGSTGAVASWLLILLVFVVTLRWAAALATALMPLGGVLNMAVGELLVTRTRPHLEELKRGSGNWEEASFPSGHVMGAVLLYGFIYIVAGRFGSRPLRLSLQAVCLFILATVGVSRVWDGAHWPTDVLSAYALGGLMLIGLVALEAGLRERLDGLAPVVAVRQLAMLSPLGHWWGDDRARSPQPSDGPPSFGR